MITLSRVSRLIGVLIILGGIGLSILSGFRWQSKARLAVDPSALSLAEASREAVLIVVGVPNIKGVTRMVVGDDGYERPAPPFTTVGLPYTNFIVQVKDVIKAPKGFQVADVLVRILGTAETLLNPDDTHLSDLRDGDTYVFFLKPRTPHDGEAWQPMDSVHVLPVRRGMVHPNERILTWRIDSVTSPVSLDAFRGRVKGFLAGGV